jgi:hypothetical protein
MDCVEKTVDNGVLEIVIFQCLAQHIGMNHVVIGFIICHRRLNLQESPSNSET